MLLALKYIFFKTYNVIKHAITYLIIAYFTFLKFNVNHCVRQIIRYMYPKFLVFCLICLKRFLMYLFSFLLRL